MVHTQRCSSFPWLNASAIRRMVQTAGLTLMALSAATQAAETPIPPLIKLVVPFVAGASTDAIARALAPKLAAALHTNVIVENKPGASTFIGTTAVIKSPPDGSVLLVTTPSLPAAAASNPNVTFDINKDLTPVGMIFEGPMILAVRSSSTIKSPEELVAAARANPGGLTYGSSGTGTILHLATELFNSAAKIDTRHIPYRGAGPAAIDVAAGTVDFMIAARSSVAPHLDAGKMRIVGVTSLEPSPTYPGVEPLAKVAPGFSIALWAMVLAPKDIPPDLATRLNREIVAAAKTPELKKLMEFEASSPNEATPAELAQRLKSEVEMWRQLVTEKGIKTD